MITDILFATLGGLGLFLFGMHTMSDSLQKLAGPRLRLILDKLTTNRVLAVMVGTGITAVIQSSSATTVMTIGLVNAGLMSLMQAIGVVLGANIGTTVTAQIIAFNLTDIALPAIGIGVFVRMMGKKEKIRYIGDFILGFGLIFYGLMLMKSGVAPIKSAPWVEHLFIQFSHTPVLGVIVGAVLTMLFQSSSATVGLVIALGSAGVLDFNSAAALILGDNIGTTITAQISAIGTNVSAKRVAMAHSMFNVLGVAVILAVFPWFVRFVDVVTPGNVADPACMARHIANFHTIFNVTNALVFLPMIGVLARIVTIIVPGQEKVRKFRLESLDPSIFDTVSFALDEGRQELKLMGKEVQDMLTVMETSVVEGKGIEKSFNAVNQTEPYVDDLQKEINTYLTELSRKSVTEEQSKEIFSMLYMVSNLERIGDHCESISKLCKRRSEYGLDFSRLGKDELSRIYQHTLKYLELIIGSINDPAPGGLMEKVKGYEIQLNRMRKEMRIHHMDRLQNATCSADAGLIYVDMLTSFEKIGDHAYNIAESITGIK
ncbi:MAG: Na/Pi cotransporter family protein [Thermodesulfobacteriota bacterium]|nr:Na/Pi cotransporter family protein [Thermodesulfobacteriota bacterium]